MPKSDMTVEFSRSYSAEDLRSRMQEIDLEAEATECEALTQRLGVDALKSFTASIQTFPFRKEGVRIEGEITAEVTQTCVASLEAFDQEIKESFEIKYIPASDVKKLEEEETELILDLDEWDEPEAIPEDGQIDLGEVATQYLVLAIDPYPRKPGLENTNHGYADPDAEVIPLEAGKDESEKQGPFSGLEALKNRLK